MLTMEQARERVARGAALLDEKRPGWAQRIDCGTLEMTDDCSCILGQLEGSYNQAVDLITEWVNNCTAGETHGFFASPIYESDPDWGVRLWRVNQEGYNLLQDCWIEEIATRVVAVETPQPVTVAS